MWWFFFYSCAVLISSFSFVLPMMARQHVAGASHWRDQLCLHSLGSSSSQSGHDVSLEVLILSVEAMWVDFLTTQNHIWSCDSFATSVPPQPPPTHHPLQTLPPVSSALERGTAAKPARRSGQGDRLRLTSEPAQEEVVMLRRKLRKNVLQPLSKLWTARGEWGNSGWGQLPRVHTSKVGFWKVRLSWMMHTHYRAQHQSKGAV